MAIEKGLQLALDWSSLEFTLEMDNAEVFELIKERTPNLSVYAFRVNAIRDLMRKRNTIIANIDRVANGVSHELAKISRTQKRTEVWLANFPVDVAKANTHDCNSTLI
jgi:hypothetical protein